MPEFKAGDRIRIWKGIGANGTYSPMIDSGIVTLVREAVGAVIFKSANGNFNTGYFEVMHLISRKQAAFHDLLRP